MQESESGLRPPINPLHHRQYLKHSIDGKFGSSGAAPWEDSPAAAIQSTRDSAVPDFETEVDPEDEEQYDEASPQPDDLEGYYDEHERGGGGDTPDVVYNHQHGHYDVGQAGPKMSMSALDALLDDNSVNTRKFNPHPTTNTTSASPAPRPSMRLQGIMNARVRTSVNDFPDL